MSWALACVLLAVSAEGTSVSPYIGDSREDYAATGLSLAFAYTLEVWGYGGRVMPLHNIDVQLTVDLDALAGWPGATLFFYGLSNQGDHPSEQVGDLQTLSNIEAPATFKLYELWLEQSSFGGRFSLRGGLYDLNSELDVVDTALLFINSSHGIGAELAQSGENGPSIFPTTSLALRARLEPADGAYLQAAVFDGVSGDPDDPTGTHVSLSRKDGALLIAEVGYRNGAPDALDFGRISMGIWGYTEPADALLATRPDGRLRRRRARPGLYVSGEYKVFGRTGERGLLAFARYGRADPVVYPIEHYLGAGLAYVGLLRGRPEDWFGLAVATAVLGADERRVRRRAGETTASFESAVELTYRVEFSEHLIFQPDVQYIVHPGATNAANALVVGARLILVADTGAQ